MTKKKDVYEEEYQESANGHDGEVLDLLKSIAAKQQEQDERLEDLEESGGRMAAELRIIELVYDTDDKHLPGLTRLPLNSVKHFARAMMIHALRDPEVRAGKRSLSEAYRTAVFTLMRSVGGEHLEKGRQLAVEKVQSELEKVRGPEVNLGE